VLIIHYHTQTGEISAWGSGDSDSSHFDNHDVVRLEDAPVDPNLHKIDLTSLKLVDKSPDEKRQALLPTLPEINGAIAGDLAATDSWMMPDRGAAAADVAAWKTYRQALRDLSKQPDTIAMVEAWPLRPDGADAAASFRLRI
jgi:hypothetical protein